MDIKQALKHFTSVPEAFKSADPELRNFLKFLPPAAETPKLSADTRWILVDLAEIPSRFDFTKALADCEIIKTVLRNGRPAIERAVPLMKQSAVHPNEDATREAGRLFKEAGFTEEDFLAKEGGFFWIVVIALLAAGCGATCNSSMRGTAGGTTIPGKTDM